MPLAPAALALHLPAHHPSSSSYLSLLHLRVEAQCPHNNIKHTPSYVLYLTGQANLFLAASFIPAPSKPNSVESVTSQARGLFLNTPQSLPQMGPGCCPATITQQQLLATFTTLPNTCDPLFLISVAPPTPTWQRKETPSFICSLPCMHVQTCLRKHTCAHAYRSTHADTWEPCISLFLCFLRQGYLLKPRLAWNSLLSSAWP